MNTDIYTKIILSLIAIGLFANALVNLPGTAHAQTVQDVRVVNGKNWPVLVYATNLPTREDNSGRSEWVWIRENKP